MKTLKKFKEWMIECGYALRGLSEDQFRYFMDLHRVFDKRMCEGMVCKFTGEIYEVIDLMCDQCVGHVVIYKTSSGKKVCDYHRL